jgi:hypothetical protein
VSGEQHLIIKNYPEFKCYRDISYYFKYFMNTEVEAFPPVAEWTQKEAQLTWKLGEAGYEVKTKNKKQKTKKKKKKKKKIYDKKIVTYC